MPALLRQTCVLAVFAVLCGCATVDFDYPRSESTAMTDTGDTVLAGLVAESVAEHKGESGFLPLWDGVEALAMRLALAEHAERSIDIQYFLIHNDVVGRVFIESLLQAADRGVRVRFLLDDIHTAGLDPGLAILDSHPNFEIRLFNPFGNRTIKAMNAASVSRIVRRMHNKSFTVDNQMTIIGGRNIGDEYFGATGRATFVDLDVIGVGPLVQDVSLMFDTYWNHRAAMPMPALVKMPDNPEQALAELRAGLAKSREDVRDSKYADAVRSALFETLRRDATSLTYAPYKLVTDSPDKSMPGSADTAASIIAPLRDSIIDASESW